MSLSFQKNLIYLLEVILYDSKDKEKLEHEIYHFREKFDFYIFLNVLF